MKGEVGPQMSLTAKVLTAAGLGLAAFEAYTLLNRRKGDTISEATWRTMNRPIVPFIIGALSAHFVWQSQDVYEALAWKSRE